MTTSAALLAALDTKLKTLTQNVTYDNRVKCLEWARDAYSERYPRVATVLVYGNGTSTVPLPESLRRMIRAFGKPSESVTEVVFPTGATPPNLWNREEWLLVPVRTSKPHSIQLLGGTPGDDEQFALTCLLPHDLQVDAPDDLAAALTGGGTGTTYGYKVTSLDDHGESLPTAEVTVSGPAALDATHYVTLTWTVDADSEVGGYRVWRTQPNERLLGTVDAETGTFEDDGVAGTVVAIPTIATTETTIPRPKWNAVTSKAAYHGCLIDAGAHAGHVAAGTDVTVDWTSVSDRRRRLAEDHLAEWERECPAAGPTGVGIIAVAARTRTNRYGYPLDRGSVRPRRYR